MYNFLQQHPDRARRFASAMSNTSPGSLEMIRDLYPWASLPKGSTVVDVGGARGHVSAYLAEQYPQLEFIVQDLQEVVDDSSSKDDGAETPYQIPDTVNDRVKLMAHDFFDAQPVKGAAVYFIRYTLHNWSDEYSIRILRHLVEVMDANSQIVIQDHVLPEPGQMSPSKERNARRVYLTCMERMELIPHRAMDLIMLSLQNSREREEEDWAALFKQTDNRLILKSIRRPSGESASGVIVATFST